MNLRQIDAFLERHSAGWSPFKGDFKISKGSFKRNPLDELVGKKSWIGKGWNSIDSFAQGIGGRAGDAVGIKTDVTRERTRQEEEAITAARKAAHDAEVAQLAQGALGAVDLRRRRGSYATRLTGSPGMGGASPGSTGKTMLGQ